MDSFIDLISINPESKNIKDKIGLVNEITKQFRIFIILHILDVIGTLFVLGSWGLEANIIYNWLGVNFWFFVWIKIIIILRVGYYFIFEDNTDIVDIKNKRKGIWILNLVFSWIVLYNFINLFLIIYDKIF